MQTLQQNSLYRMVAIILYIGVIISRFLISATDSCEHQLTVTNDVMFLSILVALVGLELFENQRYKTNTPFASAVILLLIRMVMFEVLHLTGCAYFNGFLYLTPPLLAARYFGLKMGYLFGGVYFLNFALRSVLPFEGAADLEALLIYGIGIIFSFMMANIATREEQSRVKVEQLLLDLQRSQNQVAELATEKERNRVAREIHDTVGHYLTVVGIQLDNALAYQQIDAKLSNQAMLHAKRAATNALEDVRHSVSRLRDTTNFSLNTAITQLTKAGGNIAIERQISGKERHYSQLVLTTIFRIVQESFTNIHKHANATTARLVVNLGPEQATLTIEDNGQGFDLADIGQMQQNPTAHFGILGLHERLELVGGKLFIESEKGQGTVVKAVIPRKELMIEK